MNCRCDLNHERIGQPTTRRDDPTRSTVFDVTTQIAGYPESDHRRMSSARRTRRGRVLLMLRINDARLDLVRVIHKHGCRADDEDSSAECDIVTYGSSRVPDSLHVRVEAGRRLRMTRAGLHPRYSSG